MTAITVEMGPKRLASGNEATLYIAEHEDLGEVVFMTLFQKAPTAKDKREVNSQIKQACAEAGYPILSSGLRKKEGFTGSAYKKTPRS